MHTVKGDVVLQIGFYLLFYARVSIMVTSGVWKGAFVAVQYLSLLHIVALLSTVWGRFAFFILQKVNIKAVSLSG